jgi:hypothetical protein
MDNQDKADLARICGVLALGMPILGFAAISEFGCKSRGAFSCEESYPEALQYSVLLIVATVVILIVSLISYLYFDGRQDMPRSSGAVPDSDSPGTQENYWNEDRYK